MKFQNQFHPVLFVHIEKKNINFLDVAVDLEAVSQGLGFSSFADAVSAYNATYGTNYSESEAKEALGM